MNLIQSWKESLRLLEPQNLKSFLLVTVKAFLDVYRTINRPLASRGNWVALGVIVILIFLTNIIKVFQWFALEALVLSAILHFLFFVAILAMRPSTALKDWDYFYAYMSRFWVLLIITVFLGLSRLYIIPLSFITYMFFLLFAFDTRGSIGEMLIALRNGLLMMIYNLPICVLLWGVLALVNLALYSLVGLALGYFGGLTVAVFLYIVFVPIEIAFITNLYIKFVHSQSSLYFSQPQ